MSEIIQPKINIELINALPDGPSGSTNIVPPLNPPPGPPTNWAALTRGLNSGDVMADFRDVACDGTNFVAVADDGRAARSTDGGLTWSALPQGLNSGNVTAAFKGISAGSDGVFVAAATSGWAARSIDGGATWSAATKGLGAAANTDFNRIATDGNGNWVAVGALSQVGYSTDNGATWNLGGTIGGGGSLTYQGVANFGAAGNFIVTANNGIAGITTDSGQNFGSFLTPQGLNSGSSTNNFYDPASISSTIVASGSGEFGSISNDSGSVWSAAPSFLNSGNVTAQSLGALRADGGTVFLSVQENGYASYSDDIGANWTALVQGLNSGSVGADFKGAATNGTGVWVAVALQGWATRGTE